ncbi:LuxR family transcriptional regulator [Mycolicibacterium sp. YH-1]|uniref:helix-turn-helix transcriptional regulator n=1 Tax=Mycolicibacterium sp. YH-1 TaxID=2908837 RepID=UPI001F4C34CE|nr:LuxR family transcriptional regulator [Mycolicibacterium sp. YH-1]UNB53849.1 AAA family ATPase [Mycolicibacterium sp. YH-1]
MRVAVPGGVLLGRTPEQQHLAGLLSEAQTGRSGVLIVRGEAGIGKTALIDSVLSHAPELQVIHSHGAESEMELAYAGLQQVCAPLVGLLDRLPGPQRKALQVALGLADGVGAPDQLLVGLAVLTLLAEAGAQQPTACVIDDAHWIDRASMSALTFAARRLLADRVVMVFGSRRPLDLMAGLPELVLHGLTVSDARALLGAVVPGRLTDRARDSIIAESGGNPLPILELHRALTPGELAGGYGLARARSISGRIEDTFLQQFRKLPSPTRTLLLIAAAEPTGESSWLWAAARSLGIDVDAAEPAENAGLVSLNGRMRFRHPLVRSAIYGNATLAERRRVHEALAQTIIDPRAADHRTWHRAHAASTADEQLATDLELAAEQARARGGTAAAAAFLVQAVGATPDPDQRAGRALRAAQAELDAGALDATARMLEQAAELADDELTSAHVDLLRAKMAFAARRGRDGPPLLLAAARRLAPIDAGLARETYLEAFMYSMIVGRSSGSEPFWPADVAHEAKRAPPAVGPPTAMDLLLDGLIVRYTDGYVAAAGLLKHAIAEFLKEDDDAVDPRWHNITNRVCLDLFDQDAYNLLTVRQLNKLRVAGELTMLPIALWTYAGLCVGTGHIATVAATLEEADAITTATGAVPQTSLEPYIAAYRGQKKLCLESARTTIAGASARGEGNEVTVTHYAVAILHNGLGNYSKAVHASLSGLDDDDFGLVGYLLPELIEGATRCGENVIAKDALARLVERTDASGTPTALGVAARSRALVNDGASANDDFLEAIVHLQKSPVAVFLARAHLVYGEWLRRGNRRAEARTQLRTAYDLFEEMGIDGFASRTSRELAAAGVTVNQPVKGSAITLTTQERHITRLVREGHTNSEIAAQLFISPRTVEWHLSHIFAKLDVRSRREIRSVAIDLS